jgi:hypothetical protein
LTKALGSENRRPRRPTRPDPNSVKTTPFGGGSSRSGSASCPNNDPRIDCLKDIKNKRDRAARRKSLAGDERGLKTPETSNGTDRWGAGKPSKSDKFYLLGN